MTLLITLLEIPSELVSCFSYSKIETRFAMAETIPQGASFPKGNTEASQIGNNSEAIELQSVELNQEKSSNSPETEPKNQEEVSHLKIKSLKKIAACRIIKILSLLALFGVIIFSIYHLSNTSVETKSPTTTYLVIWNNNSQPKVFKTFRDCANGKSSDGCDL